MRARLTFGIAALTLLFFVQGLSALFAALFAIAYDALFPAPSATALLLALLPIASLFTPALPFSLWLERPRALALGVAGAAAGRILLCLPAFPAQYIGAALTVASGALFLAKAVGYLDRRNVAGALALGLALDGLLRLAGGGYSLSLRPSWIPVQLVLSAAAVAATALWLRDPAPEDDAGETGSLERRAGGLRLRGALALAVLLFFELNVLSRPEVAAHWAGGSYRLAGVLLMGAGAAAVVMLLAMHGPIARHRPAALALALLATAAAALNAGSAGGEAGRLALFVLGHIAALLLLGRAVVPASGRRRGWTLAVGLAVLLVLNVLYAFTFFYAFTLPFMQDGARTLVAIAGLLLAFFLAFIPRPLPAAAPLRRPLLALPAVALLTLIAGIGVRDSPRPPTALDADGIVRVATYNVHYGFDERWRYDPERIARTIEESEADVVALQEVPAGVLAAHGTDLGRWLGHRLGMHTLHAPAINGLLGDAILTRLPVAAFQHAALPPPEADRKTVARADLLLSATDTLIVFATHLGLEEAEQAVQLRALLDASPDAPAVLLGDLNADDASAVARALRAAGFHDAFESAGVRPLPTSPAERPQTRIDWIWLRGYTAVHAAVAGGPGSDHRLVVAAIRAATTPGLSSTSGGRR